MNRRGNQTESGIFAKFTYAFRNEFHFIFSDVAVVFSMLLIPVVISFAYTYIYSKQVINALPVVVVDQDNTTESRQFGRMLDATPQVDVAYRTGDFGEAQALLDRGNARGIIVVPHFFGRDLNRQSQPSVSVYADASYILYYKQVYKAVSLTVNYLNAGIELKQLKAKGNSPAEATANLSPVQAKVIGLYNPDSGYAIFIMPAVFLVIIQTTMLTGIGLLGGTFREQKRFANAHTQVRNLFDAIAIVGGKAMAYSSVGLFVFTLIPGFVLPAFGLPQRGNVVDLYLFMLPFILSVSFLGITLNRFFRHREDAVMSVIFTSLPAVLLCGVSWPVSEIPSFLAALSQLFPSSIAIKGFVAISQAGSRLGEVNDSWLWLWLQCVFYFVLAILTMRRLLAEQTELQSGESYRQGAL